MSQSKKICPFTDTACKTCRALFADEKEEKSGKQMRGCHLSEKAEKNNDKR